MSWPKPHFSLDSEAWCVFTLCVSTSRSFLYRFTIRLTYVSHSACLFRLHKEKNLNFKSFIVHTKRTFHQLLNIPTVEFKSAVHRSFTLRHREWKHTILYTYSFLTSGVSISIWRVWEGRTSSGGSTGPRGSVNSEQQRNLLATLFTCYIATAKTDL